MRSLIEDIGGTTVKILIEKKCLCISISYYTIYKWYMPQILFGAPPSRELRLLRNSYFFSFAVVKAHFFVVAHRYLPCLGKLTPTQQ